MENFKELIKQRGIKENTQKVYTKRLEELLDNLNDKKHDSLDILKNTDKILAYVNQFKFGKKKSFINACMAGLSPASKISVPEENLGFYKVYYTEMNNINKYERKVSEEQIKTKRQQDNWASIADLEKIRDDYGKLLKKKKYNSASMEFKEDRDRSLMLKYLIASLYTMLPPRRLEYGNMKRVNEHEYFVLSNEVRENNNYCVVKNRNKKYFSFGDVKSPDPDNRIVKIDIPKKLNNIINMWFNLTDSESFLVTSHGMPMTSNALSTFMIRYVFPKNIGASMVRHIYLTEKYKNESSLKEKQELATKMNHSVNTQNLYYIKKD